MTDSQKAVRPGTAALASSVVPGWGQMLTGQQRIGRALLVLDAVILVVLGAIVLFSPSSILEAWVTPATLVTLFLINLGFLFYRGVASIGAFGGPAERTSSDITNAWLAAAVVVLPHIFIAGLLMTQLDFINTVFVSPDDAAAASPSPTVAGVTVDEDESPTTTEPPPFWEGEERLNVLLIGSDAGVGEFRVGTRTDTMILVSMDPATGNAAMISIPRNLRKAPLPTQMGNPEWDCDCFPEILGHLWPYANNNPEWFPGPQDDSVNAIKAAVGGLVGVDVQYYAKVDLEGFVAMVDALGGVTIDIPRRVADDEYPHEDGTIESIAFEPGVRHLNGHQALAYSRIRRGSNDYARMHRQRCVVAALAEQTSPFEIVTGYAGITEVMKDHLETDIPVDRLPDMVGLLTLFDSDKLGVLRINGSNYGIGIGDDGEAIFSLEAIYRDAQKLIADPSVQLETQDAVGIDATCDRSFD